LDEAVKLDCFILRSSRTIPLPPKIMNIIVASFIATFAWMVVRAFQQDQPGSDSQRDLLREDLLFIKGKLAPVYRVVRGAAQVVAGIISAVVEVYSSKLVQELMVTTRRFVAENGPIAKNRAQESWQKLQPRQIDSQEAQPSEAVVTVTAVAVVEDEQPAVTVPAVNVVEDEQPAVTVAAAEVVEDAQPAVTAASSEMSPDSLEEPETASRSGAATSARRRRGSRRSGSGSGSGRRVSS